MRTLRFAFVQSISATISVTGQEQPSDEGPNSNQSGDDGPSRHRFTYSVMVMDTYCSTEY